MTGATSRKRQKAQTRQRLLRISRRQFAERGVLATRTLDIAKEAGVSHGTVFVHFPTREDLIVRVIEEFGQQATRRTHELADGGAGVRAVLEAHLNALEEYEPFYARLVGEAALLPGEARNALIMINTALSHHLNEAARREIEAGTLRPLPMHLLFNTWIGLVHHYMVNRDLFAPGGSVIARRGKELLDHYMGLLTPEKGETR